ncbi:MAG: class I SAM-dependent methyltransferase [Elusimicrobia bacterium]|nr:class I SAM-dependent methyltransferase [Elusimicrobiota bacterium]
MSGAAWWRRAFGEGVYPLKSLAGSAAFRSRTRYELPLILRALRLKPGSELLDVCCGVGRHAVPLAGLGVRVTGLDWSPVYLAEAKRRARRARVRADFVRGDMRRMPFRERFDAALNMWTSFGYFATAAEDLAALRSVRRALKPGGLFLVDTINGGRLAALMAWQEALGLGNQRWSEMEDGTLVLEDPSLVSGGRVVRTRWLFLKGPRRREMETRVRLYTARALSSLCARAGLEVLKVYGEMSGSAYSARHSRRVVVVARRPQ